MSKRRVSILGGLALGVGMLVGPLAGQAGAQTSSSLKLSDHCVVVPLPNHLQITLCYVS